MRRCGNANDATQSSFDGELALSATAREERRQNRSVGEYEERGAYLVLKVGCDASRMRDVVMHIMSIQVLCREGGDLLAAGGAAGTVSAADSVDQSPCTVSVGPM